MALPLLTGVVILVLAIASFGYLFPGRSKHGSNWRHKSAICSTFNFHVSRSFSVILMASFSSISTWMYEYEVDRFESEVSSNLDLSLEEERWYPNYTYQSAEVMDNWDDGDVVNCSIYNFGSTGFLTKRWNMVRLVSIPQSTQ